ncbi:MAG: ribbon-helix-helix protein, CopG family [Acidimicrobiia bacterium]|nr:ribbon-helix-helix protein, CopG family [Acidimicrobiia bacterium]
MATLQVKRVPEELHAAVKERAAAEGITVSELILRTLRRVVERPPIHNWLEEVGADRAGRAPKNIDIEKLMDEVRDER